MEQNMSHACERLDAGSLIWMPAFMYEFQLRKIIPEVVGSLLHVQFSRGATEALGLLNNGKQKKPPLTAEKGTCNGGIH